MLSGQPDLKKTYTLFTMLRGIASISIVLHHFTIYLLPQINRLASKYTPFFPKSYLWVDFFFILSGFTITLGYEQRFRNAIQSKDYNSYVISRLARIYPLHILTLAFLILVEAVYAIYFQHSNGTPLLLDKVNPPFAGKHSPWAIATNVLLIQAFQSWSYWNEPAWFLSALWIVYLVMPMMIMISYRFSFQVHIALLAAAIVPLGVMIWKYGTLDFVTYKSIIRGLCEAYIGIFAFKILDGTTVGHLFGKISIFTMLLAFVFLSIALPINHLITVLLFPPLILSAASIPSRPNFAFSFSGSTFYYLGTISYSIFMIHWPVLYALKQLSAWTTGIDFYRHFPSGFEQLASLLAVTGFVIAIAHFSFYLFEQRARAKLLTLGLQMRSCIRRS